MFNNSKKYLQLTLASGDMFTVEIIERRGNIFVTTVPKNNGQAICFAHMERVHTVIDDVSSKQAAVLVYNWLETRPIVGDVVVFKMVEKIKRDRVRKGVRRKTSLRAKANMLEQANEVVCYDVEIVDISVSGCQVVKLDVDWTDAFIGREFILVIPTELSFIEFPCKIVRLVHLDGRVKAGCQFTFR